MIVRLGFVAMSLKLHDASPSKTITYKNLQQLQDDHARIYKLKKLTKQNLNNTLRILTHAQVHGIRLYRFTSKLIPLVTHSDVIDWDYVEEFQSEFHNIGSFIKKHGMVVSAHPDHFTLLNSPKKEVIETSLRDLEYHNNLFRAMQLDDNAKLVIHVGGSYSNKRTAIQRFKDNFSILPSEIKSRLIIENDDKTYSTSDVLELCMDLEIPMVLDVHHHYCNSGGQKLSDILSHIFSTWDGQNRPPKVHFSSPKSEKQFRHHADDINERDFVDFLLLAKEYSGRDIDIMLEAKNKDVALFNLVDNLKKYEDIEILDSGTIIVK